MRTPVCRCWIWQNATNSDQCKAMLATYCLPRWRKHSSKITRLHFTRTTFPPPPRVKHEENTTHVFPHTVANLSSHLISSYLGSISQVRHLSPSQMRDAFSTPSCPDAPSQLECSMWITEWTLFSLLMVEEIELHPLMVCVFYVHHR